jgi:hypothetical protein
MVIRTTSTVVYHTNLSPTELTSILKVAAGFFMSLGSSPRPKLNNLAAAINKLQICGPYSTEVRANTRLEKTQLKINTLNNAVIRDRCHQEAWGSVAPRSSYAILPWYPLYKVIGHAPDALSQFPPNTCLTWYQTRSRKP